MADLDELEQVRLDEDNAVFVGRLAENLLPTSTEFDALWALHPSNPPVITMHGKEVPLPRWQQAYGRDYRFSGSVSSALAIPDQLSPYLDWACEIIDPRLNGMLLNWYDGALGHYIGKHRDSTIGLGFDTPLVTICFGESRVFRFQKWRSTERIDLMTENGTVIVIP